MTSAGTATILRIAFRQASDASLAFFVAATGMSWGSAPIRETPSANAVIAFWAITIAAARTQ